MKKTIQLCDICDCNIALCVATSITDDDQRSTGEKVELLVCTNCAKDLDGYTIEKLSDVYGKA